MEAKYYPTKSIAYHAPSVTLPGINKEPWLHVRLISLTKDSGNRQFETRWYAVVYIWDTREIVQWLELKKEATANSKAWTKAIDNGARLKDPKNLVPNWAKKFVVATDDPRTW